MEIEEKALFFATEAHGTQRRKYKNEPYIEHPKRVVEILKTVPHNSAMVCAAYLHDVVEDTPITLAEIEDNFGPDVAKLVDELTDEYIKESYPSLNRKKRKQKEVERQKLISNTAKTIKLADIIDNTPDISKNDPQFAQRYIPEMASLLQALKGGDPNLWERAKYEIDLAKKRLGNSKK
ncbi:HD domain-containing protein [Aequorivita sp. SDUM287046]|uniref:HD domain-containing protein n=1 Tax=Aequorivita aurantiaca TaxID=3053356 RepID=A0ABT8DFK4_9FLAO|nr:HD domain-containing protein [Aequorivita aurantiaca]MDN3724126.1 HD domain-containing protein [Aequorivita aurantiaca]